MVELTGSGLEDVYLANRDTLLRFLRARGAGDAAEDLLNEVWVKVSANPPGPVGAPLPYLFRVANSLMIDRHRASRQAALRDGAWVETSAGAGPDISDAPSAERRVIAADYADRVLAALAGVGDRPARIFRRVRIDGLRQRAVAAEFGVSLSTVESDLRSAYRALTRLRERIDED